MLEIRELRHLLSIDEFRHFGRAAQAVGLSQPALTKSLQRIEQSLGAKLFERSRAQVVPTAIGKEVLTRARRLVEEAEELTRAVESMASAEVNVINVGIGPAMAETYVAAAIVRVATQFPRTHFSLRVESWRCLNEWLLASELDLYVADVGAARLDSRFHFTSLPASPLVWFCRADHPLAAHKRKKISRNDLMAYPLVTPKMPPWAIEWFAAACGDRGAAGLPSPFPAIECESYAVLKKIVLAGDCISAALRDTLSSELADGSLHMLKVDAPELTTQAGIVRLADQQLSAPAEALVKEIEMLAKSRGG